MKTTVSTFILAVAALLGGCASGGGGNNVIDGIACVGTAGLSCMPRTAPSTPAPVVSSPGTPPPAPIPFTDWAEVRNHRGTTYIAPEMLYRTEISSDSNFRILTGAQSMFNGGASRVRDDSGAHPFYLSTEVIPRLPYGSDPASRVDTMAASGHSEIEMLRQGIRVGGASQSPFVALPEQYAVLLANPYAAGWEYQSFGVWDSDFTSPAIVAVSYGRNTPPASMPATGTATFTGKMAGLYVSPNGNGSIASANLTVQADFANRSLALSTNGTTLTRNPTLAGPDASHLNFSGTLSYASNSSQFTGTLVTADNALSGSTTGRFYGPSAEELGGVFAMKSSSTGATLSGAYGAKR